MFECEVLTVRDLKFKDQQGKEVVGCQLWVIGETEESGWNGYEVSKLWFPDGHILESFVLSLKHGDKICIEFNRHGKPASIKFVG